MGVVARGGLGASFRGLRTDRLRQALPAADSGGYNLIWTSPTLARDGVAKSRSSARLAVKRLACPDPDCGGVAEWTKAPVLKTGIR